MKRVRVGKFLVVDPKMCHGKLTFRGTRVPVTTVLHFLAAGKTVGEILADWPELTREAVEEAVRLAATALAEQSRAKAQVG
jgi:uncharacterized protein (DUF433 family)